MESRIPNLASRNATAIPHPAGIFDPVARALEVMGDRWTLVLVRHLLGGDRGFQELRVRTGIAPRVLSSRLRDLAGAGFVEARADGTRSVYGLTEMGRSLEPIIASIARWWVRQGLDHLEIDTNRFTETSAQSILESLPFLLREDRVQGVDVTFEMRLTGPGGGVWTVHIHDGRCDVQPGFAERADVRYTAEARVWCGMALGILDARDLYKRGLITKDGGREAMDHYFMQISRPAAGANGNAESVPAVATRARERSRR